MKKIEIYLKDNLIRTIQIDNYDIYVYNDSIEIQFDIEDMNGNICIPKDKNYKIIIEV